MKNKKKLRVDRVLVIMNMFLLVVFLLSTAFSKAWVSKVNIDLESTRKKVTEQERINESLNMKINELASIDNIQAVASAYGLEYNNNNIVNLTR